MAAATACLSSAQASTTSSGVAALGAAKLSDSCNIAAFATAHYFISNGHATSGTWTMTPRLTCNQPKTSMSITATLLRNGQAQFTSAGSCQVKGLALCKSAAGPRRSQSYTSTIRGSWNAAVVYSVSGPDAILFAQSSAGDSCAYDAVKQRATCRYRTAPVVIR
jgi:hypothetical protein